MTGTTGTALFSIALPFLRRMGFSELVESIVYGMVTGASFAVSVITTPFTLTGVLTTLECSVAGGIGGYAGKIAIDSQAGQIMHNTAARLVDPISNYLIEPLAEGVVGYANAVLGKSDR